MISYGVTQRTFEMGLRIALGAQRASVLRLVVGEGVRLAVIGLALGIAGALAVTRLMRALFVAVSPGDPRTLLTVSIAVGLVALLASGCQTKATVVARWVLCAPSSAKRGGRRKGADFLAYAAFPRVDAAYT